MLSVCCCRQSVDTMISELDNFCCGLLIFLKVKHYDPEHKLILVFLREGSETLLTLEQEATGRGRKCVFGLMYML